MKDSSYCKVSKKCSGCQLSNLDYQSQLKYKQKQMRLRFSRICPVEKILPSPLSLHYRNKAQFVFKEDRQRGLFGGIYQSADRTVVKCQSCALHTDKQNEVLLVLEKLIKEFNIRPFDLWKEKGALKNVIVRESMKTGELMVILVTSSKKSFRSPKEFAEKLVSEIPEISSVILTESKDSILSQGVNPEILFGKDRILDSIGNLDFSISYNSFFQINSRQTENLYKKAIELAKLTDEDVVLDAYCGTGTIGILASKHCRKVYAVEQVENAVEDAKKNAALNNVRNIEFVCDDAGNYMTKLKAEKTHLSAVFLDPPRAGCSMNFLRSLIKTKPLRIVYISCNIDTQLRDIKFLIKCGYKAVSVQGVDMFPYTKHIESVALLTLD